MVSETSRVAESFQKFCESGRLTKSILLCLEVEKKERHTPGKEINCITQKKEFCSALTNVSIPLVSIEVDLQMCSPIFTSVGQ